MSFTVFGMPLDFCGSALDVSGGGGGGATIGAARSSAGGGGVGVGGAETASVNDEASTSDVTLIFFLNRQVQGQRVRHSERSARVQRVPSSSGQVPQTSAGFCCLCS